MSIAKKRSWGKNVWLWLAPNFLILIAIFIIPTFSIIRYSFTDATLTAKEFSYTLEPYIQLFTSKDFYKHPVADGAVCLFQRPVPDPHRFGHRSGHGGGRKAQNVWHGFCPGLYASVLVHPRLYHWRHLEAAAG